MKVLLVFPREPEDIEAGGKDYPLGILYIASYLKENDIDCEVFDMTFSNWKKYERKIKETKPDIIGFSIFTPIASSGFRSIKIAKKLSPKSKIIVGGVHACVDTDKVIRNKDVDIVVLGEGERTFLEIVNTIEKNKSLKNIKGIVFKQSGKIIKNKPSERIENLDSLPFPDRAFVDIEKYLKSSLEMTMITARGCPFNCVYCQPTQRKVFGNTIRRRSPENVIKEMKWLISKHAELGNKKYRFYFVDDTFTYDKKWLKHFCKHVKRLDIEWSISTRVDMIDSETIKVLKKSGCISINFGVESGSQRILNDVMKKGITVDQIRKAFYLCHKYRMIANAFIMIGSPTETKEDLDDTINLISQIHPDSIQVSITTPMIGSRLFEICQKDGISNIRKIDDYDYCKNDYPIKLENLTKEDLKHYKRKILKTWKWNMIKNIPKYLSLLTSNDSKTQFKMMIRPFTK
ncbi:MAG: radical SAM protein [Candidatus Aenigmarchaeota archaeon]|nr:radical SAM protein [Candidatus Aenigmarchaeota archaeon]